MSHYFRNKTFLKQIQRIGGHPPIVVGSVMDRELCQSLKGRRISKFAEQHIIVTQSFEALNPDCDFPSSVVSVLWRTNPEHGRIVCVIHLFGSQCHYFANSSTCAPSASLSVCASHLHFLCDLQRTMFTFCTNPVFCIQDGAVQQHIK